MKNGESGVDGAGGEGGGHKDNSQADGNIYIYTNICPFLRL